MSRLARVVMMVKVGRPWPGSESQDLAEDQLRKRSRPFQRYCLRWEEADTLRYSGRALPAAMRARTRHRKVRPAIEIYRSRGVDTHFIEYVMADKSVCRTRSHPCRSKALLTIRFLAPATGRRSIAILFEQSCCQRHHRGEMVMPTLETNRPALQEWTRF